MIKKSYKYLQKSGGPGIEKKRKQLRDIYGFSDEDINLLSMIETDENTTLSNKDILRLAAEYGIQQRMQIKNICESVKKKFNLSDDETQQFKARGESMGGFLSREQINDIVDSIKEQTRLESTRRAEPPRRLESPRRAESPRRLESPRRAAELDALLQITPDIQFTSIPSISGSIRTIPNNGTYNGYINTCMYLSIRDALIRIGVVESISVELLRFIGGLDPTPTNEMYDDNNVDEQRALANICTFFNIDINTYVRINSARRWAGGRVYRSTARGTQPPLILISHNTLHFEAITRTNTYNIDNISASYPFPPNHYSARLNELETIMKSRRRQQRSNYTPPPHISTSKKSPTSRHIDGDELFMIRFTQDFYDAIVNGCELTPIQTRYQSILDEINVTNTYISNTQTQIENIKKMLARTSDRKEIEEFRETLAMFERDLLEYYEYKQQYTRNANKIAIENT